MRVFHVNCGTLCPVGARLVNGAGGLFEKARLVCHCLVVETDRELVLVDTGLGTADIGDPHRRLGRMFTAVAAPALSPAETALAHVERLGFRRSDVRHIAPTHLDLDHIGGLSDFPDAAVHVYEVEHRAAMSPSTPRERSRYRAPQWAHGPKWQVHSLGGDTWLGFEAVRALPRTDGEVLLVPLVGHTRGHCAVAVKTPGGWLVHAGDAYFAHGEMDATAPCPPALSVFQRLMAHDDDARVKNQARLRELARGHAADVTVFSAHCPVELDRATQASLEKSATRFMHAEP